MLVVLVATAKILAVEVGTSIDLACLPCWPPALFWFSILCLLIALNLVEVEFFATECT